MATAAIQFGDAGAYERFMGRWSRAVAPLFLDWLNPPKRARWLDIGCGSGILTEALLDLCDPASVTGIDPSAAQIAAALGGRAAQRARFKTADAMELPFPDRSFDNTVSALVINFIADPSPALAEVRRVTVRGGRVGGYVWDFEKDLSPSGPLRRAMRAFGAEVPALPGTSHSSLQALESLFRQAGFSAIDSRTIDVTLAYSDFTDFWSAQTSDYSPTTKVINAMTDAERRRLMRAVQEAVPRAHNGRIEYTARANAITAAISA
jgi:ubiquinone/menaquinone biosynthesis C-methylase UbiE